MISEKSSNGDEEGQYKGTDDDVMCFAGSVHFPFYLGILHLVISECKRNTSLRRLKINGTNGNTFGFLKEVENFDCDKKGSNKLGGRYHNRGVSFEHVGF